MATTAKRLKLPPAVGMFVSLFTPVAGPGGEGEAKYRITLVWPKKQEPLLEEFKKAVQEVAIAKWGPTAPKLLKEGKLKMPLRDGDEKADQYPEFKGTVFMTASSTRQPGVVDKKVQPVMDQEEAYSGCVYRASVALFAFDRAGSKGIGVGLNNIQVVKGKEDGMPRLDGRRSAEQDFAEDKVEGEDLV